MLIRFPRQLNRNLSIIRLAYSLKKRARTGWAKLTLLIYYLLERKQSPFTPKETLSKLVLIECAPVSCALSYVAIEALGLCWLPSIGRCHTWRSRLWACDGSAGSPALGAVIRGDRGFGPVLVCQHWVLSYVEIEALGL